MDRPTLGQRRDQSVYVYGFEEGRVKVGRSIRPGTRRSQIQRAYAMECELAWKSEPHPRATEIERLAHQMLRPLQAEHREMFACSIELAISIVVLAIKVQDLWLRVHPDWLAMHTAKRQAACAAANAIPIVGGRKRWGGATASYP